MRQRKANAVDDPTRWWQHAACAGRNPAWWSDNRRMWPSAVRLCLSCPVRELCLAEALSQRDSGVIRGGMLLVDTGHYSVVPLICAHCGRRPVRPTLSGGVPRYCGRACQMANNRVPVPTG